MRKNRLQTIHLAIIYGLSVLVVICSMIRGHFETPDTDTYFDAWSTLLSGKLDVIRTPVYPCVLGIMKAICGDEHVLMGVVLLQNIVACIALWFFYKIVLRITSSYRAAFILTLIIAVVPAISSMPYRNFILTESLAMSGSIFLVYSAIAIYGGRSRWHYAGFAFWLVFLIFLRPIFVYMLPVFAVAFILMALTRRSMIRWAGTGLGITLAVTAMMLAYMAMFKSSYGIFAVTDIGLKNDLFMMLNDGTLDPDKSPDKSFAKYISDTYKRQGTQLDGVKNYLVLWNESSYILRHWDLKVINKTIHDSKTIKNQVTGFCHRAEYMGDNIFAPICSLLSKVNVNVRGRTLIAISGVVLLAFILAYVAFMIVSFRRTISFPWISFLLFMLGCSNVLVMLIGAQAEWSRLAYPSRFIFLIMIAQLILAIINKNDRNYERNRYNI